MFISSANPATPIATAAGRTGGRHRAGRGSAAAITALLGNHPRGVSYTPPPIPVGADGDPNASAPTGPQ